MVRAHVVPGLDLAIGCRKLRAGTRLDPDVVHVQESIGNDPDFSQLSGGQNDCFMAFLDDQWKRDYPVGG